VLDLAEAGFTNKEISAELHLSIRTVHAHKRHICKKLNIAGRNGLIKWLWSTKNGKMKI